MSEAISDSVDKDVCYKYDELDHLMDTYLHKIRPVLNKGKFDFIPVLNFKAVFELGKYISYCRGLGPQVQAARNTMIGHLERALSYYIRPMGIPESVRARDLVKSLDDGASTICTALGYEAEPVEIIPSKSVPEKAVPVEMVMAVAAA